MKQFRQVYKAGRGFVFRIALPGHRFISDEVFDTEQDCALMCDIFKAYLVKSYRLTGNTMFPSLAPDVFLAKLREIGADPTSPADLLTVVPASCRDYLQDGGHEVLTAFAAAQDAIKASKGKYVV